MRVQIRLRESSATTSKPHWILRWCTPVLLFFAGISALGYCSYAMLEGQLSQRNQLKQFNEALSKVHSSNADDFHVHSSGAADLGATSPPMPRDTEARKANDTASVVTAAGTLLLGKIEIPSIGLTAMVQEGTGPRVLHLGIGHIEGTSLLGQSGNIGLAGHRDTFFRNLRSIQEGDEITITTLSGSFLYRVDLISIVEPDDSQVLRYSGKDTLTLVTCYPFVFVGPAPKRFIVHARKVENR
jgi:sortase A